MRTITGILAVAVCMAVGAVVAAQTPALHWYKLNEGSGSTVANDATQSGMGTVAASVAFTTGSAVGTPTWRTPGGLGDDCVNMASPAVWLDSGLDPDLHINSTDFTIEMLINTNGATQEGKILAAMCTSSGIELSMYIASPTSKLAVEDASTVLASGTTNLNDGNWHHVAIVYDRSAQTLTGYVDGSQEFMLSSQTYTFTSNSKVVYFNGRTTTEFGRFTGFADEIKLDNTARSPSTFVMPAPGSGSSGGGGGGGDGGDDGGCVASTTGASVALWALLLAIPAVVYLRRRAV